MIHHYRTKSNRSAWAVIVLAALAALMLFSPAIMADESQDSAKKDAVTAMQSWLGEIDGGSYDQSWSDAAGSFQKALTSDKWVSALDSVRKPLGKLNTRKLASSLYQTDVPAGTTVIKGEFVIAQFETSFENLKYARETVTFQKEPDGSWRAAGYFIKPQ